ncbi:helix-turn-helix transcriptional regulator [Phenylobacterium sp.]|jgi:DNA-binding CsgD family transcriptional regulator/PAS domain-containing protein|uniref:helix-turn-helix transcriptional regulator n=1 Tax=Phenylobacterium sp. TaxID=1871053 RepID=UPI002F41B905
MGVFNKSEFLDLVYGAALEPALWTSVMERYADAIGGQRGWLSLLNLSDGRGGGYLARIDPAEMDRYMAYFAGINPLNRVDDPARFVKDYVPRILTDEDWMAKDELTSSEYYNDFLKPQGIHSCVMVRLACRGGGTATINITRPAEHGQFSGADLELANSLHPHLIRAFDLGQRMAMDRALTSGFAVVFDESAHGLFLVDGQGRLRRMNRAGETLAAQRKGLTLSGGRLIALESGAGRALAALIGRAAAAEPDTRAGGSMALAVTEGALPLSVTVAPVRLPDAGLLGGGPMVIVCVTDTEAGMRLPEHRLRDLFGLTPAEARLALALFEGASLAEAAETLQISRFTAQNHLARIFEKTGANRQAILIKLMMRAVGLDLEPAPPG